MSRQYPSCLYARPPPMNSDNNSYMQNMTYYIWTCKLYIALNRTPYKLTWIGETEDRILKCIFCSQNLFNFVLIWFTYKWFNPKDMFLHSSKLSYLSVPLMQFPKYFCMRVSVRLCAYQTTLSQTSSRQYFSTTSDKHLLLNWQRL